jgi:Integrase core domain
MVRRRRPPSQGWKTFLRNHSAGIASLDLFVVRTISFKLLYGLVILRHARRRLVAISVTTNPTAEWIAGQVTDAFPWDEAPSHLVRDRDEAFGPAYTHRIGAMGIRDHPTAPRSPWQNGHVERLIGSIRRESLDHLVVFDEAQLCRVLKNYAAYYNQVRTHLSLEKNAPDFRCSQKLGSIACISILGGLHHQYVRGPRSGVQMFDALLRSNTPDRAIVRRGAAAAKMPTRPRNLALMGCKRACPDNGHLSGVTQATAESLRLFGYIAGRVPDRLGSWNARSAIRFRSRCWR